MHPSYLTFLVIKLFRIKVEHFFKNSIFIAKYTSVRGLFEYFMSLNIYFRGNLCKTINRWVGYWVVWCGIVTPYMTLSLNIDPETAQRYHYLVFQYLTLIGCMILFFWYFNLVGCFCSVLICEGLNSFVLFQYWNVLALDGSNWQRVDLFEFQRDVVVSYSMDCTIHGLYTA